MSTPLEISFTGNYQVKSFLLDARMAYTAAGRSRFQTYLLFYYEIIFIVISKRKPKIQLSRLV